MAKSKTLKLEAGAKIRIKEGVSMPETPELSIAGWTGIVVESQGRGDALKYIVQWDEASLAQIPESYRTKCESQGVCHDMACLSASHVESVLS